MDFSSVSARSRRNEIKTGSLAVNIYRVTTNNLGEEKLAAYSITALPVKQFQESDQLDLSRRQCLSI